MTAYIWPKVETAEEYDLSRIFPAARPRADAPAAQVDAMPVGTVWHPRRAAGPEDALPSGKYMYWCLACNRRVENANQPLCGWHSLQREHYARDLRKEEKKAVPVSRDLLRQVHASDTEVARRYQAVMTATKDQQPAAFRALLTAIENHHQSVLNLPTGVVVVSLRPLRKPVPKKKRTSKIKASKK